MDGGQFLNAVAIAIAMAGGKDELGAYGPPGVTALGGSPDREKHLMSADTGLSRALDDRSLGEGQIKHGGDQVDTCSPRVSRFDKSRIDVDVDRAGICDDSVSR